MGRISDLADQARAILAADELPEDFGWVEWLTPRHMRLFAIELNAALAAPSTEKLLALLEAWQATAEMDQSPVTQQEILRNRGRSAESVDAWLAKRHTA